jgi:hypothetical protein
MKHYLYLLLLVAFAQPLLAQNLLLNRTSGNVGIGIPSPSAKLHVVGTTTLNGGTYIVGEPLTYTAGVGIDGGALRVDNPNPGLFLTGTNRLYLDQDRIQVIYSPLLIGGNSFPSPNSLLINPLGGNVGIGTSNPTYKLAVNGTIRSKELIVETGWADFVFDPTYRLRPLAEVEHFIKTHHHLPDMAPADEISQQGMPIAETTTKMMQKIEELTLYVIAQQKQLMAQQRQIRQLKARRNR